jgi:hypothetical protein
MFIQSDLSELKAISIDWFPSSKFLIMFIGVVVGPLVLLAIGGRDSNTLGQLGLAWSFLLIALLVLISMSSGFWMFRHESHAAKDISIS